MRATVFLFEMDKSMRQAAAKALLPLHVRIRNVEIREYSATLGEIAGIPVPGQEPRRDVGDYSGDPLGEPMIVFAGLEDRQFDQALRALRAGHVNVPCKAMLTLTNAAWTPVALFREIQKEREAIEAARKGEQSDK